MPAANRRLALAARKQLQLVMDTSKTGSMSAAMLANTIAYASVIGVRSTLPLAMPRDSSISVAQAAYLSNYLANHEGNVDSVALGNIEAFARKTPVVARNLGGLTEVIEESGGGFLFRTDEEFERCRHVRRSSAAG